MKGALTEIIQLATLDSDPWVLMVADILKSFPDTGSLNLDLEEQNPNVQDILGELREKVSECEASAMLPLECRYLNKNALTTLAGPLTPPVKHFQLKRKPKSATLRAELLQKSTETAQQLKRSAGVPFHAKGRGLLRKMDTTKNPCQEQGDVIQIKLSEHTEDLPKSDGQGSTTMLVDTVFEMNYATGQWTRFKKYKPMANAS
ncbi:hypothetical protein Celaphus_00017236 [Cervus elaphus hippelaphus]|uniref:HDAg domain-containing protein n=1 Tax=Cervus elaphus hippelaphus TaxID=46360 RepID=A0A212D666_CEREH|nr:hypothetical protein Celaphus_00017236 [Cervus elaphus hippelaphus]